MPPVEAMACGAPTIVSNMTSLPEVTGGASLLINPKNEKDIAESMRRVIDDSALQQRLREGGIAQAKKFTWDSFAEKHIELYKRLV